MKVLPRRFSCIYYNGIAFLWKSAMCCEICILKLFEMSTGFKLTGSDYVFGVHMYFSLCTMLYSSCIAEIKGRFYLF